MAVLEGGFAVTVGEKNCPQAIYACESPPVGEDLTMKNFRTYQDLSVIYRMVHRTRMN
jgi:hypothetical protein